MCSALTLVLHVLALVPAAFTVAIPGTAIAVRLALIEAAALRLVTIAIPHVLVATLIPARSPLFLLLIFVPFLIGHESLLGL